MLEIWSTCIIYWLASWQEYVFFLIVFHVFSTQGAFCHFPQTQQQIVLLTTSSHKWWADDDWSSCGRVFWILLDNASRWFRGQNLSLQRSLISPNMVVLHWCTQFQSLLLWCTRIPNQLEGHDSQWFKEHLPDNRDVNASSTWTGCEQVNHLSHTRMIYLTLQCCTKSSTFQMVSKSWTKTVPKQISQICFFVDLPSWSSK